MRTEKNDPLPITMEFGEQLTQDQLMTNMNGIPVELTTWETMEDRDG